MALSDFIRNIEDSPRSTKVAVAAVGVAAAAVVAAIFVVISRPDYGPEPAPVAIVVTATPTAQVLFAPSPTPKPTPVPTSTPLPTPTPKPQPTPLPTEIPLPTATPTPEIDDYYVLFNAGRIDDRRGGIKFYASYPDYPDSYLTPFFSFYKDDDFLNYLVRDGVITSKQKDDYFNGEDIRASLLDVSNAVYKMIQNEGRYKIREYIKADDLEYFLTHYADKSSGSHRGVLGGKISIEGGEGYVTISDGKISVSAVDDDGATTTVNVEGVGAKELLDYWLSRNKITIEQKNQYGQTGEIQFSLKDGVDLLDFGVSSDGGGSVGMDKDMRDKIVNEILPLFLSD